MGSLNTNFVAFKCLVFPDEVIDNSVVHTDLRGGTWTTTLCFGIVVFNLRFT